MEGTSIKVIELVVEQQAYRWSPEELCFQHPDLTLAQIHAALAYYWDHQEELDKEIEKRLREVDRKHAQARKSISPLRTRLRRRGLD